MKPLLTIDALVQEAERFCTIETKHNHVALRGVTDGKAVGTYVEHRFQNHLQHNYEFAIGNSAYGIDIPDTSINTDIKVTSIKQPQSSCPFYNTRQKIYGLGYNLLIFVYEKIEDGEICKLYFHYCTFISKEKTADYSLTAQLINALCNKANKEDIIAILSDRNLPGDSITYNQLADEILANPPEQGYLTISNALQWRLQYSRVISLRNSIQGIINYEW